MSGFPILLVCLVASAVWPSRSAVNAAWHQTDEYNSFEDNYYPYPNGNERVDVYKPTYYEYEPKYGNYQEEYNSDRQTSQYEEDNTWQTSKTPVIPGGYRWIIKLALFALPSLFGKMDPEDLRQDLEANLEGLNEWTDILSSGAGDFSVEFDTSLIFLEENDTTLRNKSYTAEELFPLMENSAKINETEATIKVLLLPPFMELTSQGQTVAGVGTQILGGDIYDFVQLAVAYIHYTENPEPFAYSFCENCPDTPETRAMNYEDSKAYSKKVYNSMRLINRVGVVMHEIGHLLGAHECRSTGKWDVGNVMCAADRGVYFSSQATSEIRCRLFQNCDW